MNYLWIFFKCQSVSWVAVNRGTDISQISSKKILICVSKMNQSLCKDMSVSNFYYVLVKYPFKPTVILKVLCTVIQSLPVPYDTNKLLSQE